MVFHLGRVVPLAGNGAVEKHVAVSITLSLMNVYFMVQIADMFCGLLCTLFSEPMHDTKMSPLLRTQSYQQLSF